MANLCMRKITQDDLCLILWACSGDNYTYIMGVSFDSKWCAGCVKLQKSTINGSQFLQVVEEIFLTCDLQEIEQFVGMARRLWLRRNEFLHDGQFRHPNMLVQ
jgi:hypothetical protein